MPHIDTQRLFEAAEGRIELEEEERTHVAACDDCRDILSMFRRQAAEFYWKKDEKKNGTEE